MTGVEGIVREVLAKEPAAIHESLVERLKQGPSPSRPEVRRNEVATIGGGRPESTSPTRTDQASGGDRQSNLPQQPFAGDRAEAVTTKPPSGSNDLELSAGNTTASKNDGSNMPKAQILSSGSPAKGRRGTMKYRDMTVEAFDFERKLTKPEKVWQGSFKVQRAELR